MKHPIRRNCMDGHENCSKVLKNKWAFQGRKAYDAEMTKSPSNPMASLSALANWKLLEAMWKVKGKDETKENPTLKIIIRGIL